jgi:hypothetical protein
MSSDDYVKRLRQAHHIEVQREAVYAAAARASRSPERQRQWNALRQLETVTKRKVAAALAAAGDPAQESTWARWSGHLVGLLAAVLPWSTTMGALRRITMQVGRLWETMEREAGGRNAALHALLVMHERAQFDFATRELRRDSATSLDAVLAMLG